MTLLATAALALLLGLAGAGFLGWLAAPCDGRAYRGVLAALAGILVLHGLLTLWVALGVPWTRTAILGPLVLVAAATRGWGPGKPPRERARSAPGWGDITAALVVAVFLALALMLWFVNPDFIFHWGLKGHRFFLARTIDFEYLAEPWNQPLNPSYPNLLPELFAASALLAGRFSERAMMCWTGLWFALLLISARETFLRREVERATAQAALATVAFTAAMVAIGYRMVGGADWIIALALVAALPPLLSPEERTTDHQLGLIAAFAGAAKTEGIVLGGLLIGVRLVQRRRTGSRRAVRSLAALLLPLAVVALAWQIGVRRYGLSPPYGIGGFEPARAPVIAYGLLRGFNEPAWHGLSWLLLPLLALIASTRRLRPLALVAAMQLAAYLSIYFCARVDVALLVNASFPRLLLHLMPALLVGGALALGERRPRTLLPTLEASSR